MRAASAHAVIKLLYEFGNQRYGLPNVIEHVKRPRFKQEQSAWLALDEARNVVEACRNDRELALTHLYMGHGLRPEEGVRLNVGDIGDAKLCVKGKERTEFMPLLAETREILLRLEKGRSPEVPLFTVGTDG